jgi:hypothetical protein
VTGRGGSILSEAPEKVSFLPLEESTKQRWGDLDSQFKCVRARRAGHCRASRRLTLKSLPPLFCHAHGAVASSLRLPSTRCRLRGRSLALLRTP